MIEAIVAVNRDWGIGADGTQSVVLSADRKHFREVTLGAVVIVGRKTLADLPGGKPLAGRHSIVLTRSSRAIDGAVIAHSPAEAVALVGENERCLVIGGASVYHALLPYCTRVYVTKLDACPPSDSFFPDLDVSSQWRMETQGDIAEEDGVRYQFLTYVRI